MPRPSDERRGPYLRAIEAHRLRPDVSLEQHVAAKMAALAREVLLRQRVYLDTRYWIFLRDAALGRPKMPVHAQLLDSLRRKVREGTAICPLGDGSLIEILRQSDDQTRLATARVIDELSLGVTIQNATDRFRTEVLHFLVTAQAGRVLEPPVSNVWLKAAYGLGILHPEAQGVAEAEQLVLAKSFFDLMWSLSVEELLTETPTLPKAFHRDFQDTATMLTAASRTHASEIGDWKALYAEEILGFFEASSQILEYAMVHLYRLRNPGVAQPTGDELGSRRQMVNVFADAVRFGKVGRALPQAQIEAGVHAIIRWHRDRPFCANDFVDMNHATAAVPYCDLFLTEGFLGTALSRPPLNLAARFGVRVIWEEEEALRTLESLDGRRAAGE